MNKLKEKENGDRDYPKVPRQYHFLWPPTTHWTIKHFMTHPIQEPKCLRGDKWVIM